MRDEANYAQDDPAFAPYVSEAAAIVEGLRLGDGSGLSELPERYRYALADRMRQRVREFAEDSIDTDEFDLEVKKMVSVACIGLREAAEGI